MFSRFVKKPGSSLHTGWTDAVNKYEKAKKIVMHTQVMDIFDGD
jgi:hypothetical protein